MTCLLAVQDANLVSSDFLISERDRSDLSFSVTENGFAVKDENAMPIEEALQDEPRVQYYRGVTDSLIKAVVEDKVDVRAYFAWSTSFPHFCY